MEQISHSRIRTLAIALLSPAFVCCAFADETYPQKPEDDDLQVRGIFESNLPKSERKHSVKAILHPHFGDLHRHDHLRIPVGMRYGLTDSWELSAEVESYIPHGFGEVSTNSKSGISGYSFGTKYHGNLFPDSDWNQVFGFSYFTPASEAPSDITDGLQHFRPYVNFARDSNDFSRSTVFWGFGLDLVRDTDCEGTFLKNAIGDDANTFTFGKVWEREQLSYTLETTYATSRLLGQNDRDLFTIRPGIIWKVPRAYTFNSRGNWALGAAVKVDYGYEGFDYGISLKLRMNLRFKD